mgnify:FL=1
MENVLLIEAIIDKNEFLYKHKEMLNLLFTLGITPNFIASQVLSEPYINSYLGTGKIDEIHRLIKSENIELVICNFDLTPTQYDTLHHIFKIEILDRTGVILQIFSIMAKSKEARLQVEIANLKYLKNRLVNKEANYSQVTSGGSAHNKGSGEKQIDLDRSKYRMLLKRKQKELDELVIQRKNTRKMRTNLPVVAIVGYTNAGKSTLLNNLISKSNNKNSKKVLEEDRLFSTLETSTRLIDIYNYPSFLLTDTVGFISHLPTMLVDAFKSTLEEIKEADLLINVVDVSSPHYINNLFVTEDILIKLDADNIPQIILYNKVDECKNIPFIPKENELLVSLNTDEDIEQIMKLIFDSLSKNWEYQQIKIPVFKDIYRLKKLGYIKNMEMFDDYYLVDLYLPNYNKQKLKDFLND